MGKIINFEDINKKNKKNKTRFDILFDTIAERNVVDVSMYGDDGISITFSSKDGETFNVIFCPEFPTDDDPTDEQIEVLFTPEEEGDDDE